MITPQQETRLRLLIPSDWSSHLQGGETTLGLDVASTTNERSNPSSLTIMEHTEIYYHRLILRWKTGDYDIMLAIARILLESIPRNHRKVMVVDKSNEKFAANKLQKDLADEIPVIGYAGNNKVIYEGQESDAKTAMGSAYSNALEDGLIALPPGAWIRDDYRLVTRNGSRFEAKPDKFGNHADTFDSSKLAYWGFLDLPLLDMDPIPAAPMSNDRTIDAGSYDYAPNNTHMQSRPF